jgi:tetratricopeptide (TPR) repeat protein
LDDYRKALTGIEELRRWDPKNVLWQRERAAGQLLVSGGTVACHTSEPKNCDPMPSLEEAEAMSLEAIAALRALSKTDLSNVSWQRDLGWALQVHAKVLAKQGRHRQTERLASLEESERVYSNSLPDKADAEGVAQFGGLLKDKSNALAELNQTLKAEETLQRAIDLFKRLVADHQDNPKYIAELSDTLQREAEIRRKAGDETNAHAAESEVQRLNEKYVTLITIPSPKSINLQGLL